MNRAFYIKKNGLFVPDRPRMNPGFLGSTANRPPAGGGGGGDTPFIASRTAGTNRDNFSGKLGFLFKPTAGNITATHLGLYKVGGNSHTHVVALYDTLNTLLVSATVDLSQTADANGYVWVTCTSTSLTNNAQYWCMATYTNGGGDNWYNDDGTVTPTSDGTVLNSAFGSAAPFSNGHNGSLSFAGPNFQYTKP